MTDWPDEAFVLGKMRVLFWALKGLTAASVALSFYAVFVLGDAAVTVVALILLGLVWSVAVLAMTVAWSGSEREGESDV